MKVINENNIEKWMFDYFEGNLSLHEKIELEGFVKENPAYQADFDAWSQSYVQEESFAYAHTDKLIKKGFFEDKKLLILFIALIGTGILIQNITGSVSQETFLANNNQKSIKGEVSVTQKENKANSNFTSTAKQNALVEEVSNDNLTGNNSMTTSVPQSSELDGVKNLDSFDAQNNSSVIGIAQSVSNHNVNPNPNDETINSTSGVNNISPSTGTKKVRELASMYAYSNSDIKSTTNINEVKKYSGNAEFKSINTEEYKSGIVEYKKKKTSFSHYKTKTLSKSLSRMLSKDLLLTVYNNRPTLKSNQMGLAINNAFAGNVNSPRLQLNYERMSMVNQNNFQFSFDNRIKNLNAGIGVILSNKADYAFSKQQAELVYAHWFNVGGVKLTAGLKGGVSQTNVNWNKIGISGLETNANDSVNNNSSIGFNVAPSFMVQLPFAYAGLQVNDAYSSSNKFVNNYKSFEVQNKANYSVVVGTDYRKNFGNKFVISPQMYIDFFSDSRKTKYTFSTTMQYNNFLVGAGYTNDKTFRGLIGFDVKGFRLAYNAQMDLDLYNVGGADAIKHEVAIQYIITKKQTGILLYD